MRTIERTTQFRRDYKREAKGRHRGTLENDLRLIIENLALDKALAARHRDHALSGEWRDHRDCHIKPDLIMIYHKPDDQTLVLVRLGSHGELDL
ncbi:type II toxin-antitoxin system YafQ family toxin [uncultured Rhodospira sp.]|uniref:type II toxin-antitoxin system YafQ family toxin n=1 Tax=uncultured Rhodospira sp. TaxID=1936189 RepID=UPI00261F7A9D|nr:type II toxin-antitoxin system YafQ family toxin [uncultured Rhodospira sp.]